MSQALDWNAKTIADFRANEGRVGGPFEGAPIVLVHHRGPGCVDVLDQYGELVPAETNELRLRWYGRGQPPSHDQPVLPQGGPRAHPDAPRFDHENLASLIAEADGVEQGSIPSWVMFRDHRCGSLESDFGPEFDQVDCP